MENQTYNPKLSELLFGEIVELKSKQATPVPRPAEAPKSLELQIEEADYLIEGIPKTRERQKTYNTDIQVTADKYLFPFRNPSKVKLATYNASDPAGEVFEDLILRTNQAILEGEIQAPPTGLFKPGDLFTICDVVVQQNEKDPYIPKTPEHISFPHQIKSLEEVSCKVGIWRAPTEENEKHPEALNLIGELIKSLDTSLYSQTRIILQIRGHFKGDESLSYEEFSKKYFSKVTDTSKHDKIELKPGESPNFLTQEIRDILAYTIDIKEARTKRKALSKRRAFETLTPRGRSRRTDFDGKYRKDETVIMPPKNPVRTSDTVCLLPKEKRASDTVIISQEQKPASDEDEIVEIPKSYPASYDPEALERAKRKLSQNHYPNSNLGGGKK